MIRLRGWSSSGYSLDAEVTKNGQRINQADIDSINQYLEENGLERMDISADGISSILRRNSINARVFGGLSLNLFVLKLDFTGIYSILDGNYGASIGIRLQI